MYTPRPFIRFLSKRIISGIGHSVVTTVVQKYSTCGVHRMIFIMNRRKRRVCVWKKEKTANGRTTNAGQLSWKAFSIHRCRSRPDACFMYTTLIYWLYIYIYVKAIYFSSPHVARLFPGVDIKYIKASSIFYGQHVRFENRGARFNSKIF